MNQCPDCKSDRAVPKWEAWDALCSVPERVAEELEKLRKLADAVARMESADDQYHGEIPVSYIKDVYAARRAARPMTEGGD